MFVLTIVAWTLCFLLIIVNWKPRKKPKENNAVDSTGLHKTSSDGLPEQKKIDELRQGIMKECNDPIMAIIVGPIDMGDYTLTPVPRAPEKKKPAEIKKYITKEEKAQRCRELFRMYYEAMESDKRINFEVTDEYDELIDLKRELEAT